MKITIEPTRTGSVENSARTVAVEIPYDDVGIETALELVAAALKAYGYFGASVDEAIPPR